MDIAQVAVEGGDRAVRGVARDARRMWLPVFAVVAAYLASHFVADPAARAWVQEIVYAVAIGLSATACGFVARTVPRPERRYWLALAAAGSFALVTDLIWAWWDVAYGIQTGPPSPSVADATTALVYICLILAVFSMTRLSGVPVGTRLRQALDAAALTVVVAIGLMIAVVRPFYLASPHLSLATEVSIFAYPVLDVGVVLALLFCVVSFKRTGWLPWESLVASAIVVLAVGQLGLAYLNAAGLYSSGKLASDLSDAVCVLGFTLFYAAAVRRGLEPAEVSSAERVGALVPRAGWADMALPLIAPATLSAVLVWAITAHVEAFTYWTAIVAAIALAVLAVAGSVVRSAETRRLVSRSVTDPLTDLFNHRFFHERLDIEMGRAERAGGCVSVALMDIDEFNEVNNVYGHMVGDQLLKWVAERLTEGVRSCDTVCRLGGDEFGIIMPNAELLDAFEVCTRLQLVIGRRETSLGPAAKVSIGLASYPVHASTREDLVRKADGALYWAKYHGRNQVVVYDSEVVQALGPEERILKIEEQSYTRTVEALAAAVDARDSYTRDHSHNVAGLARFLALEMGLSDRRVTLIEIAALLHDVGKIGVPDSVLRKPGPLTRDEVAQVREHPALGERILAATTFHEVLPWVLSHHERWDGTGYPQMLAGEDIPLEARILCICDAFDAMVSDRPYRPAMPREHALEELQLHAGTQFDPRLVDVFVAGLSRIEDIEPVLSIRRAMNVQRYRLVRHSELREERLANDA